VNFGTGGVAASGSFEAYSVKTSRSPAWLPPWPPSSTSQVPRLARQWPRGHASSHFPPGGLLLAGVAVLAGLHVHATLRRRSPGGRAS